jgi:hypothetical protein
MKIYVFYKCGMELIELNICKMWFLCCAVLCVFFIESISMVIYMSRAINFVNWGGKWMGMNGNEAKQGKKEIWKTYVMMKAPSERLYKLWSIYAVHWIVCQLDCKIEVLKINAQMLWLIGSQASRHWFRSFFLLCFRTFKRDDSHLQM